MYVTYDHCSFPPRRHGPGSHQDLPNTDLVSPASEVENYCGYALEIVLGAVEEIRVYPIAFTAQ